MEGEIKRLKRELQCEGAITKYYKDKVLLPDGNTAVWDFVGHNGAAAVVRIHCAGTDIRLHGKEQGCRSPK